MEERLQVLQQQIDQVKAKYQELQQAFDTERTAWANDKKVLEDTIVDISTSERHSEEDKIQWEQDLKAQEKRAQVFTIRDGFGEAVANELTGCRGSLLERAGCSCRIHQDY